MIQELSDALGGVSNGVVYAILALAVIQIGVQVWALVDLARAERVVGGRKWLWVIAIVFLSNLALGAILYFAIGKRVPPQAVEADAPAMSNGDKTERAVDALYGSRGSDVPR